MTTAFAALLGFLLFIYLEPGLWFPALFSLRAALLVGIAALVTAVVAGGRLPRAAQNHAFGVLLLVGVLSTIASIDSAVSLETLSILVKAVALYLMVVLILDDRRRILGFAYAHVVLGAIVGVTTVLTTRAGIESLKGGDLYRMVNYFGGLGDDPNEFGAMMVALLPMPMLLLQWEKRNWRRALLVVATLAFLLCIIRTRSRGAFLALLAMAPFLLWQIRRSASILLVTAVLATFAFVNTHSGYWDRVATLVHEDALEQEYSASSRVLQQGYALDLMAMRPWTGAGLGNFVRAKADLLALDPGEKATQAVAHNAYLGFGAEIGLPGLLAFLTVIGVSLASLRASERRLAEREPDRRFAAIARAVRIGLLGFCVSIFFLSEQYNPMLYMWVGMAVALRRLGLAAEAAPESAESAAAGAATWGGATPEALHR